MPVAFGLMLVLGAGVIFAAVLSSIYSGGASSDGTATPQPPARSSAPGQGAQPPAQPPAGTRPPARQGGQGTPQSGPLAAGSYQIRPVIDPRVPRCLGVGTNQYRVPIVVQSSCTMAAKHAYRLELVADGVYRIRPQDTRGRQNPCLTAVGTVEDARLYLNPCADRASNQRFTLIAAGRSAEYGPLYRVLPVQMRAKKLCIDLDTNRGSRLASGAEAALMACDPNALSQRMAFPRA
jgi:hypothetical protein